MLQFVVPSTIIDVLLTFMLPLGTPRKFVDISGFVWLAGHPATPFSGTTDDQLWSGMALSNLALTVLENSVAWLAVRATSGTDVPGPRGTSGRDAASTPPRRCRRDAAS